METKLHPTVKLYRDCMEASLDYCENALIWSSVIHS